MGKVLKNRKRRKESRASSFCTRHDTAPQPDKNLHLHKQLIKEPYVVKEQKEVKLGSTNHLKKNKTKISLQ